MILSSFIYDKGRQNHNIYKNFKNDKSPYNSLETIYLFCHGILGEGKVVIG